MPLAAPPRLFPWVPVGFGFGIWVYFLLPREPPVAALALCGAAGLALAAGFAICLRRRPALWSARPLIWALCLVLCGFAVAGWRAHSVAAPALKWRFHGDVEGRIVAIDTARSGAVRLTLDRISMPPLTWRSRPERVRVSLHGPPPDFPLAPGQTVATTAFLSPPQGPVEPGGFDFRRLAWFAELGAVGYTRKPVRLLAAPSGRGVAIRVYVTRLRLSAAIQARLPGETGGFAAAILTGDRAALDPGRIADLRASNLAHLLAISGLHMGLLTGVVFFCLHALLALFPRIALRWPIRKLAACGALVAGAVYLALSGANVATERAFVMVAVALAAILVERRALSLRSVAIAALIVLFLRPEALMGAGFQMSFAATTALVVAFETARGTRFTRLPRGVSALAALVLSSLVAGLATAPFAAAHFNIFARFGLLANLAAVPAMGSIVMPGALLALVLTPFGLEQVGLWAMGLGIDWILGVAHLVAGWENATGAVPRPAAPVLPLIVAGGLCVLLGPWRPLRVAGAIPILAALALWGQTVRPDILISPGGGLVGVVAGQGRVLSKERGESFAAGIWLENDGDPAPQAVAFARAGFDHSRGRSDFSARALPNVHHLRGKAARAEARHLCHDAAILVSPRPLDVQPLDCTVYDLPVLRETGAVALYLDARKTRAVTAERGQRLWSGFRGFNRRGSDRRAAPGS